MKEGMFRQPIQVLRALATRRSILAIPVTAAALAAAACGSASTPAGGASALQPCGGPVAGAVTVAASQYVMTLLVGPVEAMYSQADVNSRHPATGEVMIRGQMDMQPGAAGASGASMSGDMSGMNMSGSAGGPVRHLEIHICTASGSVVTDANPTIRVRDTTDGATANIPVAVMQGVTSGTSDLHYGNNISVTLGDTYYADVALGSVTATIRVPAI